MRTQIFTLHLVTFSLIQYQVFAQSCVNSNDQSQSVPDCKCKVDSVDHAVKYFISPMLSNLTSKTFLRYFYVDLDKPCPFYKEDAVCMMEGCSVCACPASEVPTTWLTSQVEKEEQLKGSISNENDYGWVSSSAEKYGYDYDQDVNKIFDKTLGRINLNANIATGNNLSPIANNLAGTPAGKVGTNYVQHLRDTEDCEVDDWTSLSEAIEHHSTAESLTSSHSTDKGVYVNLLNNPERFTGYGGPSARKVWSSILEENCFGALDDVCLEKRVFYRLMAGMRSSISTHIAKQYLFKDRASDDLFSDHSQGRWGVSMDIYHNAVGNHPDRLSNMYFAFLFVLRAVVRAGDCLANYPYNTGNAAEDAQVGAMIRNLVKSKETGAAATAGINGVTLQGTGTRDSDSFSAYNHLFNSVEAVQAVEECKYGFDESELFQVSGDLSSGSPQYWSSLQEKQHLQEQFRDKFRNISQIMNCVTCEKCRLWGKIQILGFGTAIKILLTPEEELVGSCTAEPFARRLLNRQEIIALLNTLNQLSKSIEFVANLNAETKLLETSTKRVVEVAALDGSGEVLRDEVVARDVSEVTTTSSFTSEEVDTTISLPRTTDNEELSSVTSTKESVVVGGVTVTVSEETTVTVLDSVVPATSTPVAPEVNTRWYAKPNSTYASGTVPSRNKKVSDHSPEYRTTLLGIFAAFVVFGFVLLFYSACTHAKKS